MAKNYGNSGSSFWKSLHHKNVSFWGLVLGCIAFIICIVSWFILRCYMIQNKMMDATYPENEPDLINQIEDMLMEELYKNNRRNSEKQSKLNEKLQQIMQEENFVIHQLNGSSLVDDEHDIANSNYSVDLDFILNTPEYNECIIEAPLQISNSNKYIGSTSTNFPH